MIPVTVGIAVRNESATLAPFLASAASAVREARRTFPVEIIACVNGSNDDSLSKLKDLATDERYSDLDMTVIESAPGKIRAQEAIVSARELDGYLCFLDADVRFDRFLITQLHRCVTEDDTVHVAYAAPRYVMPTRPNLVEWIHDAPNRDAGLLSPRPYFHGRAFMLRSAFVFTDGEWVSRSLPGRGASSAMALALDLARGPLVDDIHYSRVIVHAHGPEAIREAAGARVYAMPPQTVRDWYEGWRRTLTEIRRLDLLFPEHADVQRMHFVREVRLAPSFSSIPRTVKRVAFWLAEVTVKSLARAHIRLYALRPGRRRDFWKELASTKRIQCELDDQ